MHIVCTICTDPADPVDNLHVTNCGHLFHNHCLSEWMHRSNTCPQCRRLVTNSCIFRVYLTTSDEIPREIAELQKQLEDAEKANCEGLKENEELVKQYALELDNRDAEIIKLQSLIRDETKRKIRYMDLHKDLIENNEKLMYEAKLEKLEHSKVLDEKSNKLMMKDHEIERLKIRSDIMKKNILLLKKTLLKAEFDKNELCRKSVLAEHAAIAEKFVSFSQRLKLGQISQQNLVKTLFRIHALLLTSQRQKNNTNNEVNMSVMLPEKSVIASELSEDSTTLGNEIDGNRLANLNLNEDSESQYPDIFCNTSKDVLNKAPDFNANVASGSQYFETQNLSIDVKDTPNLNLHLPTESLFSGNSSKSNDVITPQLKTFNETLNLELNVATPIPDSTSKDTDKENTSFNLNEATGISDNTSKDTVKENTSLNPNEATGISKNTRKDTNKENPSLNLNEATGISKTTRKDTAKETTSLNLNEATGISDITSKDTDKENTSLNLNEATGISDNTISKTTRQDTDKENPNLNVNVATGFQDSRISNNKCAIGDTEMKKEISETTPEQSTSNLNPQTVKQTSPMEGMLIQNVSEFASLNKENSSTTILEPKRSKYQSPHMEHLMSGLMAFRDEIKPAQSELSRKSDSTVSDELFDDKRDEHLKELAESTAKINWPKYLKSQEGNVEGGNSLPVVASTSEIGKSRVTPNEKPLFEMILKRFEK